MADERLLVGSATADDAAVFRLDANRALVQTVDFFTPIVDDPYAYGQIAAANSLSDVYAMGGRPLTAMNLVGVPTEKMPLEVVNRILKGGASKTKEAGCVLAGGHSVRNPEPFYGLSVTGLVNPRRMITNAGARAGDWLVLTKPLGTGIVATGVKRGKASPRLARASIRCMARLNVVGAEVAERGWVRAGTDVTGFGLLGHLGNLCRNSGLGAELWALQLPVMSREVWSLIAKGCVPGGTRKNFEAAQPWTEWEDVDEGRRWLAADAQTSGGLLLCVPVRRLNQVLDLLRKFKTPAAAVVGRLVASRGPFVLIHGKGKPAISR
jgi:selenide,water dikinase